MKMVLRWALLLAIGGLTVSLYQSHTTVLASDARAVVELETQNSAPRQVEESTRSAVIRDYSAAWQSMSQALAQNRADLLGNNFVGAASQRIIETIRQQNQAGLYQRISDKGHQVEAVFYSAEGSAMELHDTAQVQVQLLEGDKVIHSEDATVRYVVLLTAAENAWKVRVLQAVPSF